MSFESDELQASSRVSRDAQWVDAWYGDKRWTRWLLPLTAIFIALSTLRRWFLKRYCQKALITPVVVIGNITVGGTGKTPLIIEMVKQLRARGLYPGVISRGYGSQATIPTLVSAASTASMVGDEPISIYHETQAPICVGVDRIACAKRLEDEGCNVILSDDGLQHYRLGRHLEIAVLDGERGIGNGWRLPVGPLRESVSRLKCVDWTIVNNPVGPYPFLDDMGVNVTPMAVVPKHPINLLTQNEVHQDALPSDIIAVAGIGNPERFRKTLVGLGFSPQLHVFADHHSYTADDFAFAAEAPVIMTHKDAVKCHSFAKPNWYYVPIRAQLPDTFWDALVRRIQRIHEQHAARFPLK